MIEFLIAAVALIVGAVIGYVVFRYVVKGKYNQVIAAAEKDAEKVIKDAEVVKEKKLLEVKEKFLNKKSELEKDTRDVLAQRVGFRRLQRR